MANFFKKMFNKEDEQKSVGDTDQKPPKSSRDNSGEAAFDVAKKFIEQMIQHADFRIDFSLKEVDGGLEINFYGEDEDLFTFRSGQVMDALQLLLKRAVDRRWPEDKVMFYIDTNDFKKNNKEDILATVKRLRQMVLDKGKPMYTKTYLPKDRRLIHQQLNDDADVKSRSVGEGLYKKVKIYPVELDENKN